MITLCVFSLGLIIASVSDIRWHRIPNAVTVPLALFALAINAFVQDAPPEPPSQIVVPTIAGGATHYPSRADGGVMAGFGQERRAFLGTIGFRESIFGFIACGAIMLVPYALAQQGAGDTKLAAAIGAGVGAECGVMSLAYAYGLAGVFALVVFLLQRQRAPGSVDCTPNAGCEPRLPLAPFLSVGSAMAVLAPPPFTVW